MHCLSVFLLQMFLLKIPDGLFGSEAEHRLLSVLELNGGCEQCDAIHWYVNGQTAVCSKSLALELLLLIQPNTLL